MGITLAISGSKREDSEYDKIIQLYNRNYILSKLNRVVLPFLFIFFISLLFGIFNKEFYFGWLYLVGRLPVIGPGNYFASILLQYILVGPLIYYFYRKTPVATILVLYLIEILFQIIVPHISIFENTKYLYSACIVRYFSAIALGLYLSNFLIKKNMTFSIKKNWVLVIGLLVSVLYLLNARCNRQPFTLF